MRNRSESNITYILISIPTPSTIQHNFITGNTIKFKTVLSSQLQNYWNIVDPIFLIPYFLKVETYKYRPDDDCQNEMPLQAV